MCNTCCLQSAVSAVPDMSTVQPVLCGHLSSSLLSAPVTVQAAVCYAGMYCATVARVQILFWIETVLHVLCFCAASNVEHPELWHPSKLGLLPGHPAARSLDLEDLVPPSLSVTVDFVLCLLYVC